MTTKERIGVLATVFLGAGLFVASSAEAGRIHDRLSRDIYRQKHDGQTRQR